VAVNSVSELYRYIDQQQLTDDFNGSLRFSQRDWIQQQLVLVTCHLLIIYYF